MSLDSTRAGDPEPHAMPAPIICGLDGSHRSADVARIAGGIAGGIGADVEFVHVLEDGPWPDDHPSAIVARLRGQAMLDGVRDATDRSATRAHLIGFGDPAYWIASTARTASARLIVIGGSSERQGRAVIGPAATRLAVAAPCPVLVLPRVLQGHIDPRQWAGRTFVCGLDGSPQAFVAAVRTGRLAGHFGGALMLVAVGPGAPPMEPIVERLHARLSHADGPGPVGIEWTILTGDPAWELECAARALTAPVLAIGSHGHGSDEPVLGSVAWRLLVDAKRSVLVVPGTIAPDG